MTKIEERKCADGSISFRVVIRKKNNEISRTFYTKEDAVLFSYYKERLIDNIENFEVPIEQRITLHSIFEMKIKTLRIENKRTLVSFENSFLRLNEYLGNKPFYHLFSYEDFREAAKKLANSFVYRGGTKFNKSELSKRMMSPKTLRNIFAYASSAISYAISLGINIENHPQKVIQTFIKNLEKSQDENEE